jgi:hypothetical protein
MDENLKKQIDSMSYEQMLRKWRHAAAGDPTFIGETGDYFSKVMAKKECDLKPGEKTKISKKIGW